MPGGKARTVTWGHVADHAGWRLVPPPPAAAGPGLDSGQTESTDGRVTLGPIPGILPQAGARSPCPSPHRVPAPLSRTPATRAFSGQAAGGQWRESSRWTYAVWAVCLRWRFVTGTATPGRGAGRDQVCSAVSVSGLFPAQTLENREGSSNMSFDCRAVSRIVDIG